MSFRPRTANCTPIINGNVCRTRTTQRLTAMIFAVRASEMSNTETPQQQQSKSTTGTPYAPQLNTRSMRVFFLFDMKLNALKLFRSWLNSVNQRKMIWGKNFCYLFSKFFDYFNFIIYFVKMQTYCNNNQHDGNKQRRQLTTINIKYMQSCIVNKA